MKIDSALSNTSLPSMVFVLPIKEKKYLAVQPFNNYDNTIQKLLLINYQVMLRTRLINFESNACCTCTYVALIHRQLVHKTTWHVSSNTHSSGT